MDTSTLVRRNLAWFWRSHLAVVAGIAVAVSVLAGALLVGDSVRASLRRLALERLGQTAVVVTGTSFVREALAGELAGADPTLGAVVPIVAVDGFVTHDASGRRAGPIPVFGVDERFWAFHGVRDMPRAGSRDAWLSPALAEELGAAPEDALLVRVQKPSSIPAGVLQGRRDDTSRAVRLTVKGTLERDRMGEFSLSPTQGPVRALFVPMARLQRDLEQPGRVNALLVAGRESSTNGLAAATEAALAKAATSQDLGLKLIVADAERRGGKAPAQAGRAGTPPVVIESETGLIDDRLRDIVVREAARLGFRTVPVLTYLANTIRVGEREIPYSVITGLDVAAHAALEPAGTTELRAGAAEGSAAADAPADGTPGSPIPLWLNEWAAGELQARGGEAASFEYYLWSDEQGLQTRRADATVAGVVPMAGAGGDRTLTPDYPGITDAARIGDWDPPFPVDLQRIRPQDDRYWQDYRAAPKAFVPLQAAQRLWPSPFGSLTSIRVYAPDGTTPDAARDSLATALRTSWTPALAGLAAQPVRERALSAARGSTDFGEYFVYFSFFLVVSGLLLTGLFFTLGIEQRAREIGLLQAMGFTVRDVRRLLLAEGTVLAVLGSALGLAGAIGFGSLILYGLRTWWVDAVGTRALALEVAPATLAIGGLGGTAMAVGTIWWTLRRLARATPRSLMGGAVSTAAEEAGAGPVHAAQAARKRLAPLVLASLSLVLVALSWTSVVPAAAGFFGAGVLLLAAALSAFSRWLRQPRASVIHQPGAGGLVRLGARQATWRPGRTLLSAALIAAATFIIVSVGAFRRDGVADARDPRSGTGGFPLYAEALVPLMHDPGTSAGRAALGLPTADEEALSGVKVARFRLRPGDEGSCLNLYRPTSPRILAPTDAFRREGRFAFGATIEASDAERRNPWLLLDRTFADGAIPVIGDANSLTYALHTPVGSDFVMAGPGGTPITLRVVAALADSMFQSELLVSEANFVRLFPRHEGYRFFLVDVPAQREAEVASLLEDRLADSGFDLQSTAERQASYHRVENTYLSTFQTLGGFGLVLGTFGLGAVLLRNVLERRRELALLRAVGYRASHLSAMVLAESAIILAAGLAAGIAAAALAIAPALAARGGSAPLASMAWLLAGVVAAGLLSTAAATRAATSAAILKDLRSE